MHSLNLGCGNRPIAGWMNLDLGGSANVVCDLRGPIPYPDASVKYVYSEHFIEHLDEVDGFNLMKECYRVLIPGGILRFSCPDLAQYVQAYLSWEKDGRADKEKFTNGVNYLNYAILGEARNDIRYLSPIRNSVDYGHRYYYDEQEMTRKLTAAGFRDIVRCSWRESQHPELRNLEWRPSTRDLIMEGVKKL